MVHRSQLTIGKIKKKGSDSLLHQAIVKAGSNQPKA
jgi:hypothetical protein